ncbi:hypothetical protein GUJ93_ZPchr0014g47417 [Zizania palustris]|uniref:Uncharacterized protein n=1 Tax=Zizania palustris TaxID=103762 RepID=A0A8J5W5X4_ZIZPA|nr:hypothetical protein GUJ93_ZPchr0014g47417 [Zizania palustris]
MASLLGLKKNYRCYLSLQQFYADGPFAGGSAPGGGGDEEAFLACASAAGRCVCFKGKNSKTDGYFLTVGERGIVRIWCLESALCIFEQQSSDVTIKTNECISTYDKHDGKVWALAVGRKTEMLVTGGTDAILNLWHDCTMEDKQEDFRKMACDIILSLRCL